MRRIRSARLAAGALLVAGLCACGTYEGPRLEVESDGAQLVLRVHGIEGARIQVLGGRPWRGADPVFADVPGQMQQGHAGQRVIDPAPPFFRGAVPVGRPLRLSLGEADLAALPEPFALQAIAKAPGPAGPVLGASNTIVVRREGPRFHAGTLREHVLHASWIPFVLRACLPLLALLALARVRWRAGLGTLGLGIAAAALVATIVHRVGREVERPAAEKGRDAPPLLWPGAWELGGDALERIVGSGVHVLVEEAQRVRRADEPIVVWTGGQGDDLQKAVHLAHALGADVRQLAGVQPTGLVVFVGVDPIGEAIFATDAGILARAGGGE